MNYYLNDLGILKYLPEGYANVQQAIEDCIWHDVEIHFTLPKGLSIVETATSPVYDEGLGEYVLSLGDIYTKK